MKTAPSVTWKTTAHKFSTDGANQEDMRATCSSWFPCAQNGNKEFLGYSCSHVTMKSHQKGQAYSSLLLPQTKYAWSKAPLLTHLLQEALNI